MKKLILHIGGPKCGSSTLQNHFCNYFTGKRGVINQDGDVLRYAAIRGDGVILKGRSLQKAQSRSPLNYVSSTRFPDDTDVIYERLLKLKKSVSKKDTVILSNEGWASAVNPAIISAFDRLGVPVEIFFVTRPPIDWMNAGWWQWGAWTQENLEQWVHSQTSAVKFFDHAQNWRSAKVVSAMTVVDVSQDILSSVAKFLKVDEQDFPAHKNVNVGTNYDLLRHLVNNKEKYGREIHRPGIEFALNNILDLPRYPPPFVITKEMTRHVISETKSASEKLLELFEQSGRPLQEMSVQKYLNADAYANVDVMDIKKALSPADNDAFIGSLLKTVLASHKPDFVLGE